MTLDRKQKPDILGVTAGIAARSPASGKPILVSGSPVARHDAAQSSSAAAQTSPSTSAQTSASLRALGSISISLDARQTKKVVYLALFGCSKGGIAFGVRKVIAQATGVPLPRWKTAAEPVIKATLEKLIEGSLGNEYQGNAQQVVAYLTGDNDFRYWRNNLVPRLQDYDEAIRLGKSGKEISKYVRNGSKDRLHRDEGVSQAAQQVEDQKMENDLEELRTNRRIHGTDIANW